MSDKRVLVTQIGPTTAGPSAGSFSLATSFTTPPTVVRYLDNLSFQINTSTTDSAGSFAVQVSDDYYVNEGNDSTVQSAGNWSNLVLSGSPVVAAANDTINISLNQVPFYAIRLSYTASTAGTGTCTIFITHKGLS